MWQNLSFFVCVISLQNKSTIGKQSPTLFPPIKTENNLMECRKVNQGTLWKRCRQKFFFFCFLKGLQFDDLMLTLIMVILEPITWDTKFRLPWQLPVGLAVVSAVSTRKIQILLLWVFVYTLSYYIILGAGVFNTPLPFPSWTTPVEGAMIAAVISALFFSSFPNSLSLCTIWVLRTFNWNRPFLSRSRSVCLTSRTGLLPHMVHESTVHNCRHRINFRHATLHLASY